ncbi:MAG: MinD/ParA family protein [Pseudomonadota bacterium]|nr:cobyrinic acid a,c-diamide synthase [Alphaproteobacteria bacterium]MCS5596389.1 MinD/ParA family protein [Alphaproteobacteria bacterium]MEC7701548.1 MinD/ParA family protein [Pseudomonadota bacterium]MED5421952.1 MinD/ParA family protein [Pseudomonadota bacterium]|tara:strand:- start:299023 stop:299868 length:846 start_codon:yes stop_codon:yes gene_type:complete
MNDASVTDKTPNAQSGKPVFRRGKNIIAVASGKGGVGKTWFSITLAHTYAQMGHKVLLFDGDLGLANVDVQLGLMPKRDLNDVIRGRLSMSKVIQPYEDGGFDIIAGRSGQASLSALPSQRLALLRDQLLDVAGKYDVVIIDLGAGVDRTVRMLSSMATRTLLISTDEPTSLTDAYAFIKLGSAAGMSKYVSVVVNMVQGAMEGEKTYKTLLRACENFLRIKPPLAGIVHMDSRVKDAIRSQTPILKRSPGAEAAMDVEKIARQTMRDMAEERKKMAAAGQ